MTRSLIGVSTSCMIDRHTHRLAPRARPARGGPGAARGVAVLLAALVSSAVLIAPSHALETPVATTEAATARPAAPASASPSSPAKASFIVKVGVVERMIEIDWTRARHADLTLAAGGTRLAPGADAVIKALAKDLALTGDKRERYLLFARATDPKPSAADLQLRARIVRNGLVAAAGAPQDAIVVASWTGTGDPPGASATPGTATGGFILVPVIATNDTAQVRALALDSAFAGVAELIPPASATAAARPPVAAAPVVASPIATPTPPTAPSVTPPAAIATPKPPQAPRPSVAAATSPTPASKPSLAPSAPYATASIGTPPKPSTPTSATSTAGAPAATAPPTKTTAALNALAALLPLPKARPAASAPPTNAPKLTTATPPAASSVGAKPPRAEATHPDRPARVVAADRPDAPAKPRVTTPRPPVAKAEPARRPPTRVADCAPPRVILDDFYRGGPIVACDGSRR